MTRTVKIIPHPTTPGHWTILVTDPDGTESIYGCWNDFNNAALMAHRI